MMDFDLYVFERTKVAAQLTKKVQEKYLAVDEAARMLAEFSVSNHPQKTTVEYENKDAKMMLDGWLEEDMDEILNRKFHPSSPDDKGALIREQAEADREAMWFW